MRKATPTDSQAASQPDSEGTLRAELLGALIAAERELSAQLSELLAGAADPALIAQCRQQLGNVATVQDAVGTAAATSLAALRADVKATASAAASLTQQARAAATASNAGDALSTTGAALRSELTSAHANLFERRIFDSALTFATTEDETAYRRREAEARRYIDQQMAVGTPEGQLNAAGATMGHMLDAHTHGAGNSAEFLPQWNRLAETTERHRAALRVEGRSTEEYDRNLNASIRRYLKDKGLTEAKIDAALAASANPLDAVKPYLTDEKEAAGLTRSMRFTSNAVLPSSDPLTVAVSLPKDATQAPATNVDATELADAMAAFRAAGVTAAPQPAAGAEPPAQVVGGKSPSAGLAGRE